MKHTTVHRENLFVGLLYVSPKDGGGLTISGNLKSFQGPVLNLGTVQTTVVVI
jgi:hypothetical protein